MNAEGECMNIEEKLQSGNKRAVARLITMLENKDEAAFELLKKLHNKTGNAYVIGITGPPGAGKSGLQYAASKGLPVMIMEPLRGGKLVTNLPKEVYKTFDKAEIKRSPAEWALKWIWDQPEVTLVLSGMNSMEMLDENMRVASETEINAFTDEEKTMFEEVKKILQEKIKVPCTGCNYCMPCPVGVDIPTCLSCYNDIEIEGKMGAKVKYLMQTSLKSKPHNASLCVMCGKCEEHCPQDIEIMKELKNVTKNLEGIFYKPVRAVAKRFMRL